MFMYVCRYVDIYVCMYDVCILNLNFRNIYLRQEIDVPSEGGSHIHTFIIEVMNLEENSTVAKR
jgi:hypothetical protein